MSSRLYLFQLCFKVFEYIYISLSLPLQANPILCAGYTRPSNRLSCLVVFLFALGVYFYSFSHFEVLMLYCNYQGVTCVVSVRTKRKHSVEQYSRYFHIDLKIPVFCTGSYCRLATLNEIQEIVGFFLYFGRLDWDRAAITKIIGPTSFLCQLLKQITFPHLCNTEHL